MIDIKQLNKKRLRNGYCHARCVRTNAVSSSLNGIFIDKISFRMYIEDNFPLSVGLRFDSVNTTDFKLKHLIYIL